jgi:hypothetical protein
VIVSQFSMIERRMTCPFMGLYALRTCISGIHKELDPAQFMDHIKNVLDVSQEDVPLFNAEHFICACHTFGQHLEYITYRKLCALMETRYKVYDKLLVASCMDAIMIVDAVFKDACAVSMNVVSEVVVHDVATQTITRVRRDLFKDVRTSRRLGRTVLKQLE